LTLVPIAGMFRAERAFLYDPIPLLPKVLEVPYRCAISLRAVRKPQIRFMRTKACGNPPVTSKTSVPFGNPPASTPETPFAN